MSLKSLNKRSGCSRASVGANTGSSCDGAVDAFGSLASKAKKAKFMTSFVVSADRARNRAFIWFLALVSSRAGVASDSFCGKSEFSVRAFLAFGISLVVRVSANIARDALSLSLLVLAIAAWARSLGCSLPRAEEPRFAFIAFSLAYPSLEGSGSTWNALELSL